MKTLFRKKNLLIIASIFLILIIASGSFWQYNNAVSVEASGMVSIDVGQGARYAPGDEIIAERTENSKKYYTGENDYALDASMGTIHYKDNYADDQEQWKDIDLTFENNQITKAPYILTVDEKNMSITVYDKKTGQTTSLGLSKIGDREMSEINEISEIREEDSKQTQGKIQWSDVDTDLDIAITAQNTRVRFDWIVKSENAPHEVEFEIKDGGIPISYQGTDADGNSIEVAATKTDNGIIERIEKGGKYPKVINPVIDVNTGASADDCIMYKYNSTWTFSYTSSWACVGSAGTSENKRGSGLRFTNITIPAGSSIGSSYLSIKATITTANSTVNSRITGNKENNPAAWSTIADYQARRGTVVGGANNNKITSAQVNWDNIPSWSSNTWYNSPGISTIIQELVNAHAPNNEALALFWDDHEYRGGAYNRTCRSYDYDGATSAPKLHIEYTAPSISNTPSSVNLGPVGPSSTVPTGLSYFSVTNNSESSVNITISGTDLTGGTTWTLSDTATPGSDTAGIEAGLSGGDYDIIVKKNAPFNTLKSNLASSASQNWGFQLLAPTNYTDATQKAGTITLTATVN
jgi:hypothetical protein